MSGIYGVLNVSDTERVFLNTLGQQTVYDAVNEYMRLHNEELAATLGVFVGKTTDIAKERYFLPGGGQLQDMGFAPQAAPAAVKTSGYWDVAYPLNEWGAQLSGSRVAYAYATVNDLAREVDGVRARDVNTVRYQILNALLGNTQTTFSDPIQGSLSIEPLANGDSVLYPPVLGATSEATENHYLESGYTVASISDTNNPAATVVAELEEHFGAPTGGSNIAMFVSSDVGAKLEPLTDFVSITRWNIQPGANTAQAVGLPAGIPGRILGVLSGAWIVEWRYLPATYTITVDLDAPAPLAMRVDPGYTGLGSGLQLVATSDKFPFTSSFYSHRFGVAVANRLNGVVMEVANGGGYTVPTGYL